MEKITLYSMLKQHKSEFPAVILCIVCLLGSSSCTQAPPEDCADELVRNVWVITDDSGKEHGNLSFENNRVKMDADVSGKNFHMNEECIVDTEKVIVSSENFGQLSVQYRIDGEKLYLEYFGREILLTKKP